MFTISPITSPKANLSGFLPLCTQSEINRVDALRVHEVQKFAELCGETAYMHIYQAFAFNLPPQIILQIQDLGLPITISGEMEGLIIQGIASASLATWKRFLELAHGEWLIKLASHMYESYFRHIPYFSKVK